MDFTIFGEADQKKRNMLAGVWRKIIISRLLLWAGILGSMSMLLSCGQEEGVGGTGSIQGRITEAYYNADYSRMIYSCPAGGEEVYIVYGEEKRIGERIRTNQLGQFSFTYLFPGHYEVFYRSLDSTLLLELDTEKVIPVNLGRGQDLDLGELTQLRVLDYNEGSATIKGQVKVKDYVDASSWPNLVVQGIYPAVEQEVYLSCGPNDFYLERVRTQYEGYFEFQNLIPGTYLVFLYSDDVRGESDKVTLKFQVSISELDQQVDLGEIVIEKL